MKWIETKDRLPELNSVVLICYRSGDVEYKPYTGPEDWWKRNVAKWMDETPEFIIDDNVVEITEIMRDADRAFENVGGSTRHYIRDVFIPMLNEKGWHFCRKSIDDKPQQTK